MKRSIVAAAVALALFLAGPAHAAKKADEVRVYKSERVLLLYRQGALIKAYRISLGPTPVGDKLREGDGRTPEGRFRIEAMDPYTKYYKAFRASTTGNVASTVAADPDASASPTVVIHGQRPALKFLSPLMKRLDWTDGSIALGNRDMDEVWDAIGPETLVAIEP